MPRIIVLALTAAALSVLTFQNLATEVPLVILGSTFVEAMPFGLLLLIAVGIGALLTLIFYGLVGSRRPPESKYRPMGRRVPYPDGPSNSPIPASDPSYGRSAGSSSTSKNYGSSSAFVSEPKSDPKTSAQPFVEPPKDSPVQDTPSSKSSGTSSSSSGQSTYSSYPQDSVSARDDFAAPPNTYFQQSDAQSSGNEPYNNRVDGEAYASPSENRFNDSSRSASAKASSFVQQPIAGLKSVFGKKKERKDEPDMSERPIGDDWGQRRTKEQINSWDTSVGEPSRLEEGAKSLFNFGRNVGANAGRLAEDIASGWNNQSSNNQSSGDRGDGRYADARYDERDQGWENFDDYSDPPREAYGKRTYGDSLYDNDDGLDDGYAGEGYVSEGYADEHYGEDGYADDIGPEGVYDADYKVIVPPSKPLDDEEDRPDDYA